MTCPSCNSIWLRPIEPAFASAAHAKDSPASKWHRHFICGGCGVVLLMRITAVGQTNTDREKNHAHHNPAPPVMLSNGGSK